MRELRLGEMAQRGGQRWQQGTGSLFLVAPVLSPQVFRLSLAFLLHLLRHFKSTPSSKQLTTSSQSILLQLFGKQLAQKQWISVGLF
uniref:Uncharacterized protein n=1 Tax=Prolemur simus TaxID=1328070 RepID=A0A8C9APQ7_PROSS